ncbi:putative hydrolase, alpha/beta fold protein [Kocuria dechangensis]|uniref:Hydrolase, alpha/beta fold protein n=1 Tax=Kocuria dechangensis TaxID=1176249 RepID=A0A917H383_9MICC|nr:alpha/beta hydrolase [Kocuria dechangensis]GGG65997.1 putative hydrolase, alpha/beta fold protein [Kocuria dechangensis]
MSEHFRLETPVGTLAVRTVGDPGLPVALLWHSLFVDDSSWTRVERDLAADRRLVLVTGPGHGASSDPGHRYTLEDCAAAAAAVIDALEIQEPVDWVGNAWGGHVGIVFAATWPQRCRSLIAIGAPVHAYTLKNRLRVRALLDVYRLAGPVTFIRDAVAGALLSAQTHQRDREAQRLVRSAFAGADRHGMANAVESISLRRPDLTPMLSLVSVPTLFITGSEHPDWSPAQAEAASRLLPHGSAATVDEAAYLAPLEEPAEVTRLVRNFWRDTA